jgi:hypothetical protein
MLWLAVSPTFADRFAPVLASTQWEHIFNAALSATVSFLLAYAVSRMVEVVQGDVSLAIMQSSLLEKAVQRRTAAKFEEDLLPPSAPIAGRRGFGRPLQ